MMMEKGRLDVGYGVRAFPPSPGATAKMALSIQRVVLSVVLLVLSRHRY
jgi:hypothetical protein